MVQSEFDQIKNTHKEKRIVEKRNIDADLSDKICKFDGYNRDPDNCELYYKCTQKITYTIEGPKRCDDNTFFDPEFEVGFLVKLFII